MSKRLQKMTPETDSEQAWVASFNATTDQQWDKMAATVRQEIAAGHIFPLEDVHNSLPPVASVTKPMPDK